MEITRKLIAFALNTKIEDIPEECFEVQKHSLMDALGCIEAATTQNPAFPSFVAYAREHGEAGPCRIFSTDLKVQPDTAAFVNAALSHSMDLEDTCQAATLHSNAVTTPALLALSQYKGGVSGRELLAALLIGSEIACRVSIATGEDLAKHGWHTPHVFGSYGAVLAGCRLMGYDYEQTLDALGANAYAATGLSQMMNDKNSLMRAVRDGFGAKSAVQAILLAKHRPHIGFEELFEGEKGFFKAYSRAGCVPEKLVEDLGKKWYASELVIKFWPACLGCHTSIQSTIEVMKENDLKFEDILSVDMKGSEFIRSIVVDPREVKNRPVTAISAKFSIPYCMGLAAKKGRVVLSDFMPENLPDEDIYSFAERVNFSVEPEYAPRLKANFVDITYHTSKGDFFKHKEAALGDPSCPLTDEQFHEKFISCTDLSANKYTREEQERLIKLLDDVENAESLEPIIELL